MNPYRAQTASRRIKDIFKNNDDNISENSIGDLRIPTEVDEHLKGLDLKQYCATSISLGIHHAVAILNDKDTKGAYLPIVPAKKLLNRMKEKIK